MYSRIANCMYESKEKVVVEDGEEISF